VNGDGVLDLELNRGDGGVMRPKDNPYLIPPDGQTIVYSFDRTTRKMKPALTASVPNGSSNLRMHATVGVGPAANMKRLRSPTARDTAR
jgi:hypothetical protein